MHTKPAPDCTRIMPRPHDLLWLADIAGLSSPSPLPCWATPNWLAVAPVVMRREKVSDPDCIPVGLRGQSRSQRHQGYLSRQAVGRCVSPESLVAGLAWSRHPDALPPLAALAALAPALSAIGLPWGPTGGVGFALASGLPVLRPDSDLDLVVRAFHPLNAEQTALLLALRSSPLCRIDLQIETGNGAFSLSEWSYGHRRVLLKTDRGPILTADPWHQPDWTTTESSEPS
jgi:phosphoribosyl-dephospho-CoA transferase